MDQIESEAMNLELCLPSVLSCEAFAPWEAWQAQVGNP